jgi:ABC-type lipoprotein release transport system permease subunit
MHMCLAFQLLEWFAILGIVISGLGVYVATVRMAASRNREIGVRMALGAPSWGIACLVLWRGIRPIFIGFSMGLFFAWILAQMLSSFIFQVNTSDSLVWTGSCLLLLCNTTIVTLIPTRRTTCIDSTKALRGE